MPPRCRGSCHDRWGVAENLYWLEHIYQIVEAVKYWGSFFFQSLLFFPLRFSCFCWFLPLLQCLGSYTVYILFQWLFYLLESVFNNISYIGSTSQTNLNFTFLWLPWYWCLLLKGEISGEFLISRLLWKRTQVHNDVIVATCWTVNQLGTDVSVDELPSVKFVLYALPTLHRDSIM